MMWMKSDISSYTCICISRSLDTKTNIMIWHDTRDLIWFDNYVLRYGVVRYIRCYHMSLRMTSWDSFWCEMMLYYVIWRDMIRYDMINKIAFLFASKFYSMLSGCQVPVLNESNVKYDQDHSTSVSHHVPDTVTPECMFMGSLQWHHSGRDSVSNHQPHDCLLNRWFRRRWKRTSKLRVTGLCAGNSPGSGEFLP